MSMSAKTIIHTAISAVCVLLSAGLLTAQTAGTCAPVEWTLTAGQNMDVGTVAVSNDKDNLYVEYKLTYPGATFGMLHLWVGTDLENMPADKGQGGPVPGQFPYWWDATGKTYYKFAIPLKDIMTGAGCGDFVYIAAHAEVYMDGKWETAYGGPNGMNIKGKGKWWYYGIYMICCDDSAKPCWDYETAFAYGTHVFSAKVGNPDGLGNLNLKTNRWGWAIYLTSPGSTTWDIYAAAGQNDRAKGTKVGTLTVNWTGSAVEVTYNIDPQYKMFELHLYASNSAPTTAAPGQYGKTEYFPNGTNSYNTTITGLSGSSVWIIAHAIVGIPTGSCPE